MRWISEQKIVVSLWAIYLHGHFPWEIILIRPHNRGKVFSIVDGWGLSKLSLSVKSCNQMWNLLAAKLASNCRFPIWSTNPVKSEGFDCIWFYSDEVDRTSLAYIHSLWLNCIAPEWLYFPRLWAMLQELFHLHLEMETFVWPPKMTDKIWTLNSMQEHLFSHPYNLNCYLSSPFSLSYTCAQTNAKYC